MNKLLLALSLSVLLLFVGVRADGGSDEDPRQVEYSDGGSSVEFQSQDSSAGNEIKFHAEVSGDGLFIELEYSTQSGSNSTDAKFRSVVSELIEYVEVNGQAGYQDPDDTLVNSWLLGDSFSWTDFQCTLDNSSTPEIYTCVVATSDGTISAAVYITTGVTDINGVPVKPTTAKVDLNVTKSSTNNLAVVIGFQSDTESDINVQNESSEEQQGFTTQSEKQVSFGTAGFFSWVETATLNGNSISIINSNLTSGSGGYEYMTYSFVSSDTGVIVWDPKIATQGSSGSSDSAILSASFCLVFAILALLL